MRERTASGRRSCRLARHPTTRCGSHKRRRQALASPVFCGIMPVRMRTLALSAVVLGLVATGACAPALGGVGGEAAVHQRSAATAWPAARFTPIALPKSGGCPRSPGGRAAPNVGITLGDGPAYPVLGFPLGSAPPSPGGVVSLRQDRPRINGRYAQKVLWAVAANAARFTVTAGRLRGASGDRRITFDFGDGARPDLHLMGSSTWTYQATTILVKRPGCYEFQINSATGYSTLVFEAVP